MALRLLKFDIVHPKAYLIAKKQEWNDLDSLSAKQYRQRLIALRSNYSDFYTHYLNELGWKAEEFFLHDPHYIDKIAQEMYGFSFGIRKQAGRVLGKIRPLDQKWTHRVIRDYINHFKPDVIFARSQPIGSQFWQQFRDRSLLVSRLSARMPKRWHPEDWDVVFTDLDIFKKFFELHDVPTYLNKQGFDPRINSELVSRENKYEVVFIGGLGSQNFSNRTHFFEEIASKVNFKWWGYWWEYGGEESLDDFPNLKRTFQGPTSGIEMYQIYKDSKIILNDYVDTSGNVGFNQRMFEAMGVGGCMLTRNAENFEKQFPENIFVTYDNVRDCIAKIEYFQKNEAKRIKIGQAASKFVAEHYSFEAIAEEFDNIIRYYL